MRSFLVSIGYGSWILHVLVLLTSGASEQNGQETSKGFEVDLRFQPVCALQTILGYTFTDAKVAEDNDPLRVGAQLINSARHAFNARYSLSAGVGHYGLESVYRDSYNSWNLTLTAALKPFELQLAWLGVDPDINQHFSGDSVGNRVAFTALWRFSTNP